MSVNRVVRRDLRVDARDDELLLAINVVVRIQALRAARNLLGRTALCVGGGLGPAESQALQLTDSPHLVKFLDSSGRVSAWAFAYNGHSIVDARGNGIRHFLLRRGDEVCSVFLHSQ